MSNTGYPLWFQLAWVIVAPPIGVCLWWLMSRGWATMVQTGAVSERTKRRQRIEFWALLIGTYVLATVIFAYAKLR